ncbi:hypothetical protein BU23DRAFT_567787 [Bimuria novae-zelandiae CBS 107.79]|uniref:Uncharacterized protein n=1 Tax=Bimuria novae-zelandiae CBS 107.79 TaxID=1447943 RepID=A0A6A5VDF9_9PLEO|nr:hypothetical protein BU23DRAFT_567787 [Bimuria novae-zelandiae CBS 107.79]
MSRYTVHRQTYIREFTEVQDGSKHAKTAVRKIAANGFDRGKGRQIFSTFGQPRLIFQEIACLWSPARLSRSFCIILSTFGGCSPFTLQALRPHSNTPNRPAHALCASSTLLFYIQFVRARNRFSLHPHPPHRHHVVPVHAHREAEGGPARTDADFRPATKEKYDRFPEELRRQVNEHFSRAALAGGFDLLGPVPTGSHQHYRLFKGVIYRWPLKAPEFKKIGAPYQEVEAANIALLDELLKETDFALEKKESWVELVTPFVRVENPDFLHLHMLRRGDIGWGFDAEKGLSVACVEEFGALADDYNDPGELCLRVYFMQFMRGSEVIPTARDPKEETRLREQQQQEKENLFRTPLKKLASPAKTEGMKKNPLLEAEEKAAAEKKRWEEEEEEYDDEDEEMADDWEQEWK